MKAILAIIALLAGLAVATLDHQDYHPGSWRAVDRAGDRLDGRGRP